MYNNIKVLREMHRESAEELGAAIGKSQPTICKWEKKEKLKYEDAELIATHYNVPVEVVLGKQEIGESLPSLIKIDVLDAIACCGDGIESFSENVIGQHMMTLPALREFTMTTPDNIKIIRAIGDSMLPTITPGDMVWIDISQKSPTSDGLYLLCVGRDLMIKRIQINPFNNSATIKSDNPRYATFEHKNFADIRVLGRVIYHIQRVG